MNNELLLKNVEEKLKKELGEAKLDQKAKVIISYVKEVLLNFSKQESEFAQAIIESNKTLGECCTEILKGIGSSISDLEVCKKAAQFYFSGADISFEMKIDLCASVKNAVEGKNLKLSLLDFL